jgi:hypothetical protein
MKLWFCLLAAILLAGCSRSNNLLLGRVEATVGSHKVVVTDCYRFSFDPPRTIEGGYRFTPCRDADVLIHSDELIVNGKSYGHVNSNDSILVDHGVVWVNDRKARRIVAQAFVHAVFVLLRTQSYRRETRVHTSVNAARKVRALHAE